MFDYEYIFSKIEFNVCNDNLVSLGKHLSAKRFENKIDLHAICSSYCLLIKYFIVRDARCASGLI